jgi:hypothetical protein
MMNNHGTMQTKSDNYEPTKAEERLLMALAAPENRMLTVVELCGKADISRDTYYRSIKKRPFEELVKQLGHDIIHQHTIPLVQSGIDMAMKGSFQHWKVLLEMAGLYDPKRLSLDGENGEITIRFVDPRQRNDVSPKEYG